MKALQAITDLPEARYRRKCHYRVRWFYAKGAFLILLWTFLESAAASIVMNIVFNYYYSLPKWLLVFPVFVALVGSILSGWLADAKLGNYKVIRWAFVLLFIAQTIVCVYFVVGKYLQNVYIAYSLFCVFSSLFMVGLTASIVTSLQLGLDQMPEASSSNITAFIAWYIFSIFAGAWTSCIVIYSFESCINELSTFHTNSIQLLSLLPPLCTSIILVSDQLLSKKWLIIEPKSPQSLKTIYQVLRFCFLQDLY